MTDTLNPADRSLRIGAEAESADARPSVLPGAAVRGTRPSKLSPILGLPIEDDAEPHAPGTQAKPAAADLAPAYPFELSVIVPARNEEANLKTCLDSLLAQNDDFFLLGRDWELIVVDDDSTDSTATIASEAATSYSGVRLLHAPHFELRGKERGFTGKTNACWAGAQAAQGRWLLFTDADTIHESGNLRRALHEAGKHDVVLLSYSPRQLLTGLAQHLLMPLIFSELASVYPPAQVNDPATRVAAANGQFLLVEREAYFAAGGHRVVGRSVLEDVDLAWNLKRAASRNNGRGIRLRYAPDAVSARMYRGFADMMEGWTKNLALLFPHALQLAAWRLLDTLLLLLPVLLFIMPWLQLWQKGAILLLWLRTLLRFYTRVSRSNFGFVECTFAFFGLPLFIFLLVRSWFQHRILHTVSWKGREYRVSR